MQLTTLDTKTLTMTSFDLLDYVNAARLEFGETEIRRNDFNNRCKDELDGEHYEINVVKNQNGTESECIKMTRDQCMFVLMRESKGVRRKVAAKINAIPGQVNPNPVTTAVDAFKMIPMIVRAAKALGLDKNAAAISANQAVLKITGSNVLSLLGHTHLDNPEQKLYFTPTEIGERMGGLSAQTVNRSLEKRGMQSKVDDKWVPNGDYAHLFRILDTGKRHGNGTMIQQVKWSDDVMDELQLTRTL